MKITRGGLAKKFLPRIFDAHIHCSDLANDALIPYAKANGMRYNFEELLYLMGIHKISSGILLSPPLTNGLPVPNQRIIDFCIKSKDKLYPVLTVEPDSPSVQKCISLAKARSGFVKGFKIRLGYVEVFPFDRVFSRLYDYAESNDLPVLFHTGDTATTNGSLKHAHPLTLDPLANKRPELKIVACHFGNPWIMDTAELLYKHKNVFADISGLFSGGSKYSLKYLEHLASVLSSAIYHAGSAEKVIFGTDYPVETFGAAISLVGKLKLDSLDKEKIFGSNATRLFSI